jgi:hypothetical protein
MKTRGGQRGSKDYLIHSDEISPRRRPITLPVMIGCSHHQLSTAGSDWQTDRPIIARFNINIMKESKNILDPFLISIKIKVLVA